MTTRNFVWLSTGGGAWSLASNWDDTTDGTDPSNLAPGAQDSVMIGGPTGSGLMTLTGPGQAAAALFTGNTLLSGTFSIAALTLGQTSNGGLLELAAGTALSSGTATVVAGSLLVGSGARLAAATLLTLGNQAGPQASLDATSGGTATVAALFLASANSSIYVDPQSVVEIGPSTQGTPTASAGFLTIDAGATLSGQGNANAYGSLANDGTITATGGTLTLGTVSGRGRLGIAAAATLRLNGACGAGQTVAFTGAGATLALSTEFDAPAGTITGLATGDLIDVLGSSISSAGFQASAGGGTLTLYYGTQAAATLILAGTYSNDVFLTAGDGAGGTLIAVAPSAPGGGTPSPGTTTPDQYLWTASKSGAWITAANWTDVTRSQTPAAIAPGVNDLVTIAASAATFTVIAGPANAAALALTGQAALSGAFNIGTLSIGTASGNTGTLDLLAGTSIATTQTTLADGALSVAGSASLLTVSGTLALGGGPAGIGLPATALTITAGGIVRAAALTLGGGAADSIVTDPTGLLEVGNAGTALAGAVTIDAGATLSGNGQVNPLGTLTDNGTILATGGTLTLGTIGGTGALTVAAGATLELLGPTALPITLPGSATTTPATLAFAGATDAPTGTITGLVNGDVIHFEGSPLTAVQFAPGPNGSSNGGTLLLIYGTTIVARLNLAGNFTSEHFLLTPDGIGGEQIEESAQTGGGGGTGQSGTDQLSWTSPVSGAWSHAGNWTDLTIGHVATLPPGAQTPVQLAGPTGTNFQDITGTGTCASLSASGNTVLSGTYTTGQISLATAATLLLNPGTLSATQASLSGASLITEGSGVQASISGTIVLSGSGALLAAEQRSGVQTGSLSLTGTTASVTVDSTSFIEVGTAGGAAGGAITIDPGAQASGTGSLNLAATIIDNGTIAAQGGTLWLGAVSGTGTLSIGTGATLALAAPDSCAVAFAGGAATLLLDAAPLSGFAPAAPIAGFVPGDAIVIGTTPIDSLRYQPGAGGIGTLTLLEAGQTVGTLVLAGSYAGDSFAVQPDGTGGEITVAASGPGTPPPGTTTPDNYVWLGGQGPAWSNAANWQDVTAGQNPAILAPGLADAVAIAGATSGVLTIAGPANAASLALTGTVSLSGSIATGALDIGGGLLAIGAGDSVAAGTAIVAGAIALDGGTLAVQGALVLGQATAGALTALAGTATLGAVTLAGPASALAVSGTAAIEIGGNAGAAAGSLQIDAGANLQGAGQVTATAGIVDDGTITASSPGSSSGTLSLGAVTGTGTLLVGVGAELALQGTSSAGLVADFAGGGTLYLGQAALAGAPAIADFGPGDQIELAISGAVSATYFQTAPGLGELAVDSATGLLAQLVLLGSQQGLVFNVAGSAGGGTVLTAAPAETTGGGGGNLNNPTTSGGLQITPNDLETSLQGAIPAAAILDLANLIGNTTAYEWFSVDGSAPASLSETLPNIEVVGPLPDQIGGGNGPAFAMAMSVGYRAVLLEGGEPVQLTDGGIGHALLSGNAGADSIAALGDGDTMVGAAGANTVFWASLEAGAQASETGHDVTITGGGNDTISTNSDSAAITTSGGHSVVFLGSPQNFSGGGNDVVLDGSDEVVCGGLSSATDDITVNAAAGLAGDTVFGSAQGVLTFTGGNTPSTVVGGGGQIEMTGGDADGSVLWAGRSAISYLGGAGSAIIVGGASQTYIQGGEGPVTVFGGSGLGLYSGAAGSIFVIGGGPSTVQAAAGVGVFLYGNGAVSVAGSAGADAYGGSSDGADTLQAGAGNETLWGGTNTDLFLAGTGDALLVSGGGTDTFSFTQGLAGGADTIVGFNIGPDTIDLKGFGVTAPAITYAFGDSILSLADGTTIVVYDVAHLTASSITLG